MLVFDVSTAQKQLSKYAKERRLAMGLTQEGLAVRAGVSLASLRKFEQKGLISLETFLQILMVVGGLEAVTNAIKPEEKTFHSIHDVFWESNRRQRKKGCTQ